MVSLLKEKIDSHMMISLMQGGKFQANREDMNLILFGRLTRSKDKSLNLLLAAGTCCGCHTLTPPWSLHCRCLSQDSSLPTFPLLSRSLVFLYLVVESANSCDCFGLWQDWQERCHRESLCGLQQHRSGAAALVRHVGQPPAAHCTVAHLTARGGGRCHAGSQEVN